MDQKQIVSAVISMSLDGYIAGENAGPDQPLGDGGLALHEWVTDGSPETRSVFAQGGANLGAVVCGRLTYDWSVPWWKENGPTGEARLPVIVIADAAPDNILPNGVYTFVKDEDAALELAKKSANGKDVSVMGGAGTIQKFLNKGYIDHIQIQLIPILLGGGKRLFDHVRGPVRLKPFQTLRSENAIHLGFSVEHESSVFVEEGPRSKQ